MQGGVERRRSGRVERVSDGGRSGFLRGRPTSLGRLACIVSLGFLLAVSGCKREREQGQEPPPPPEPVPRVCDAVSDAPVEGLIGRAHGFCIDPRSDVRRYGTFSEVSLDAVCTELFNGECEVYKTYGLEGVKVLRYVAADGTPRAVSVIVSLFHRTSGAFGFYTRRILGSGLPSQATVHPLKGVDGRAALGVGVTYLWRGKQVVELTYVSDEETPQEVEQNSPDILVPLTQSISRSLLGATVPDKSVLLLETPQLDELGVKIEQEVMGVPGTGDSAIGYYSGAEIPHRVAIAERHDKTGVLDLVRVIQRAGGYKKLEGRDVYELRITAPERPPETWYARRQENSLLAVGPLETSPVADRSTPKERKDERGAWKQFAVRRLMEVSAHARSFEKGIPAP